MLFRIFSLYPDIFESFLGQSLIARGLSKRIIEVEINNWRDKFSKGNYKQVDDRPFGGGSGMVLQVEPIFQALSEKNAISPLFKIPLQPAQHSRIYPNNADFFNYWSKFKPKKATISLTARGFPLNQQVVEWLANFEELNILCGRFEGFDARASEFVDLELSLGNFVLNGGEVAAMTLVEAASRLIPDFITKNTSAQHDSFSSKLNQYEEQKEFVIGKRNLDKFEKNEQKNNEQKQLQLFDNNWWQRELLPKIEHPQYTRPAIWQNLEVPKLLLEGNHKQIQGWRKNWFEG